MDQSLTWSRLPGVAELQVDSEHALTLAAAAPPGGMTNMEMGRYSIADWFSVLTLIAVVLAVCLYAPDVTWRIAFAAALVVPVVLWDWFRGNLERTEEPRPPRREAE